MKPAMIAVIVVACIIIVGVGSYFLVKPGPKPSENLPVDTERSHFTLSGERGTTWWRSWDFHWNAAEPQEGTYDWSELDNVAATAQADEIHLLACIFPYADWDQEKRDNHQLYAIQPYIKLRRPFSYVGPPVDMEAYKRFVGVMVERYDGDGENDMPGLRWPIKYWEVMNEPEFQAEGTVEFTGKFFKGTSADYFNILKNTYEVIKAADSQAKVLHAGLSGAIEMYAFWQPVFDLGAENYLDIANPHYINAGEVDELLKLPEYREFYASVEVNNPMWMTELSYTPGMSGDYAGSLVRSSVYAVANGVEKIFYVYTDEFPISAFSTMVNKIDYFSSVEKITEEVSGRRITAGRYKFVVGGKPVYVLWGSGSAPSEITGAVVVTDISGNEQQMQASQITLSDSPVFVELI